MRRLPLSVPLASLVGALLLALATSSCAPPDNPPPSLAGRLIEVEPSAELHREWAGPRSLTRSWDLLSAEDRATWTVMDGASWTDDSGVRFDEPRARLIHSEPIYAPAVSGLKVILSAAGGCEVRVLWGVDPLFLEDSLPVSGDEKALWVDLSANPDWRGTVDGIRLMVRKCVGRRATRILLEAPAGGTQIELPDDLPPAWKATLAQDTRSAVVAPPGTIHRWNVTAPVPTGQVRFALGVLGRPAAAVTFDVRLEGDREQELGSYSLGPDDWGANYPWHDVTIPVRDLTTESRVAIETRSEEPWTLQEAVPVLAGARVVAGGGPGPLNVVLISIDTLRPDRLSLYGYERETTPNLDRRARDSGIAFRHVVAPAGWTLPSHVSMFSGINSIRHGVNFSTPVPKATRLLAEHFAQAGFETIAFSAGGYVSSAFGLSRGFDSFRTRRAENPSAATSRQELEDGVEQFNDWLDDAPTEPFFAFFHTYEVHAPYWARAPFFERFGGDSEELPLGYGVTNKRTLDDGRELQRFVVPNGDGSLRDADPELIGMLYDSGIAYMDSQIERIFEKLDSEGLAGRTVVVLTSDHGEALMEHDFAGHGPAHDEVVMVPLIIWLPQHQQGAMFDEQVQLVDLAPTLLDLVGIEVPDHLDGADLRPLWEGTGGYPQRPAFIHAGTFGIAARVSNRLKYIWHRAPWDYFGLGEELYDLRADPGEADNLVDRDEALLASSRQITRDALADQLPGFRMTFDNPTAESFTIRVGGENNLRSAVTPLGCDDLEWQRGNRFSFVLSPKGRCDVTLEYLHAGRVSVELLRPSSPTPRAEILRLATREIDQPRVYSLEREQWELDPKPSGTSLQLACGWKSASIQDGEAAAPMDEALAEQLRALGYIE